MKPYFIQKIYENRKPPKPQEYSPLLESLFQFFAILTIIVGAWYIHYRWTVSLNYDALWFSIPLVFAETMMFIGTILVMTNFYFQSRYNKNSPPKDMSEVVEDKLIKYYKREIKIDIYIPIYNEEPELIEYSIIDAKKVKKLENWQVNVYLLDDSKNEEFEVLAKKYNINQITRDKTKGRKAGAITNAINIINSDFIVIIDSDTRLFPDILLNIMGYFRDDKVAWVQTPQWFYDTPKEGDIFANDPQMFFDVIQRRRNKFNASFCCGATSIHRVDALKKVAIARWVERIKESKNIQKDINEIDIEYIAYHASEDIYTSLLVHGFDKMEYKSILHPQVESKMLSPQDLLTWITQRFRYAGGTIDLMKREYKKFFTKSLNLTQKMMYFSTFWSYTGAIWTFIFLLSPIIYLFTNIAPVSSYSMEFFKHLIAFLLFNQISLMLATWSIETNRGAKFFIAIFPIVLEAFYKVIKGEKIVFNVTSKVKQDGNFLSLIKPQLFIIVLTTIAIIFNAILILIGERINYTGFSVNLFWSIFNISALMAIVKASLYKGE